MKKYLIPSLLVISLFVPLLPFVQFNTSLISIGLCALYGFGLWLEFKQSQLSNKREMDLVLERVNQLNDQYEQKLKEYQDKFDVLESEMGKMSLSISRVPGASQKKDKPSILF